MKICDLTQFYSPLSGGVKRYVHEKIGFIQSRCPADEHVLIVPGEKTEVTSSAQSRIYSLWSPLVSRTSRYRALINLRAIDEILERERPDLVECSDPYQLAWKAIASGAAFRIPVVAFYHSHFPEANLRTVTRFLGHNVGEMVVALSRSYVRNLYNRFAVTMIASEKLANLLSAWGVGNVRVAQLGVNTDVFNPHADRAVRGHLGLAGDQKLLLYVGRLAQEKNTSTLFAAFDQLTARRDGDFHLLVIGDGPDREELMQLQSRRSNVSWIQYCNDSADLARYYRAADLFVHPGVQETFGFVALESQACGTPVVGIRGTSMDRVILHQQESWAQENSPAALADAIEAAAAQNLAMVGHHAAQIAASLYTWDRVFDQLFCIYREVCANYRRP